MKILIAFLSAIGFAGCDCGVKENASSPPVAVARSPKAEVPQLDQNRSVFSLKFSQFTGPDPDAVPPQPGQAYVRISKDDPVYGPVVWMKIHRDGDRLGWAEEDGVVTAVHAVFSPRKQKIVSVDFDTKAVLTRIESEKPVPHRSQHCPVPTEPLEKCPGPSRIASTYKVNEATIVTETGSTEVIREITGPGPTTDDLCLAHGGIGEALTRRRTGEAKMLFWAGEDEWRSKTPEVRRRSREYYRRLLKEFPAESVVTQNAERIKTRAEAEIEE